MPSSRKPPKRTISKLEAIRHLLHSSIRMHFAEEDMFAIHLIVQSTEKLLRDYGRRNNIENACDLEHLLRHEKEAELYKIDRETYNYFKHADSDHDKHLGVYDIVQNNELAILMNISGAVAIGLGFSAHMNSIQRL